MLVFRRVMRVVDAAREVHFLLRGGLRAYVLRTRGIVVDNRLFRGTRLAHPSTPRHAIQIVLAGRLRLAHAGRAAWLGPGEVSLQTVGFQDERWEGEPFEAVVVEWSPACSAGRVDDWTVGRLPPADLARIARWGAALAPPGPSLTWPAERAAAHTAALLAVLEAAGFPIRPAPAAELAEPIPGAARRLASAMSASLSNLQRRPMMVDLETSLGRSDRQLRRAVSAFDRYYDFPGGASWHRILHWWRLAMATSLMTARGATTARAAAALGYGSPRSLCLAMAQAGLPSPGRVARAVHDLR